MASAPRKWSLDDSKYTLLGTLSATVAVGAVWLFREELGSDTLKALLIPIVYALVVGGRRWLTDTRPREVIN